MTAFSGSDDSYDDHQQTPALLASRWRARPWRTVPGRSSALPRPAFRLPHFARPRPMVFAPQHTSAQSALGAVRRSFRNLVIAQEAYFASHHAYAADLAKLAQYRPEPGVSVALVWAGTWAGKSGWRGAVSAQGSRGTCVISFWFVHSDDGSATNLEKATGETGEKAAPGCDGDAQPAPKP
jgi:hypothetical protein